MDEEEYDYSDDHLSCGCCSCCGCYCPVDCDECGKTFFPSWNFYDVESHPCIAKLYADESGEYYEEEE